MQRTGIKRARMLRQRMTDAERKLWLESRDRRLNGFKFKRQVPIGRWTVDFLCVQRNLVVEVDGGQHSAIRDAERDAGLERSGYRVLHFWNNDVITNTEGVLSKIREALGSATG